MLAQLVTTLALAALRYDILAALAGITRDAEHQNAYRAALSTEARALAALLGSITPRWGGAVATRYGALDAARAQSARSFASHGMTVRFARGLRAERARAEREALAALATVAAPVCPCCQGHGDVPTGHRSAHNPTGLEACRACELDPPHSPSVVCACDLCVAAVEEALAVVSDQAAERALDAWRATLAGIDRGAPRPSLGASNDVCGVAVAS